MNHPLHALAWAGAGDLLARLGERRKWSAAAIPGALAVAAPLLAVLAAPARTFVVADKFLWTLHVDYISEFSPLLARVQGVEALLVLVNILPLIGLAAVWLLWRGNPAPASRALLALSLMPAALFTLLTLSQQRWLHVADALWLGVLVAAALVTTTAGNFHWTAARRIGTGLFLALALLPYPLRAGLDALRAQTGLSRENIRQFVVRDLAWWLRRRTGTDPVTVLSGPTATTELIYHGGFKGVGTLYWENLAGLRALVDIYGAADPDRALELLRARGVTHLVILRGARLRRNRRGWPAGCAPPSPCPPAPSPLTCWNPAAACPTGCGRCPTGSPRPNNSRTSSRSCLRSRRSRPPPMPPCAAPSSWPPWATPPLRSN